MILTFWEIEIAVFSFPFVCVCVEGEDKML